MSGYWTNKAWDLMYMQGNTGREFSRGNLPANAYMMRRQLSEPWSTWRKSISTYEVCSQINWWTEKIHLLIPMNSSWNFKSWNTLFQLRPSYKGYHDGHRYNIPRPEMPRSTALSFPRQWKFLHAPLHCRNGLYIFSIMPLWLQATELLATGHLLSEHRVTVISRRGPPWLNGYWQQNIEIAGDWWYFALFFFVQEMC
jgi:hypothetical protein